MKHDYLLDKSTPAWSNPFMASNHHFFLGLAAATTLRMSFFMLASNLRVGTCFSNLRLPLSIIPSRIMQFKFNRETVIINLKYLFERKPQGFDRSFFPGMSLHQLFSAVATSIQNPLPSTRPHAAHGLTLLADDADGQDVFGTKQQVIFGSHFGALQ